MRVLRSVLFTLALLASSAPAFAVSPVFNGTLLGNFPGTIYAASYGVKCNGTADDTTGEQNAINAAEKLAATKTAAEVINPGGTCQFSSTLNVTMPNVTIRGQGDDLGHDTGSNCTSSTTFKWIGVAGSTIMQIAPITGASAQGLYNNGVVGICFTSNTTTKAAHALSVLSTRGGKYSVFADNTFSGSRFYFGTVSLLGEATDVQHNDINVRCDDRTSNEDCIYLDGGGSPSGNVSMNVIRVQGDYFNGNLITCNSADNNIFENVQGYRVPGGTGYGVDLKASCYSNTFLRLTPGSGGVLAETGSANNTVISYDVGANGSPTPTIQSGASLGYTDDIGNHYNFRYENMAVGANAYEAGQAMSRRDTTASLYVYNGGQNHIKLDDGTQTASVRIGPNHNLDFLATSGTVKSDNTFFVSSGTAMGYQLQSNTGGQTVAANSNAFAGGNYSNGDSETDIWNSNNSAANTASAFRFYGFQNGATNPTLFAEIMRNGAFESTQVSSQIAAGSNASEQSNARARIGSNETLRLYNGSSNHMVLDDGTNTWGVNIDGSGNLRFSRLAGTGGISAGGLSETIGSVYAGNAASNWLNTYAYGANTPLYSLSSNGQVARSSASRTSDQTGAPGAATSIGDMAWGFNDKASGYRSWARYAEARAYAYSSIGPTITNEQDITNFASGAQQFDPYKWEYGQSANGSPATMDLWLASGGNCTSSAKCYNPVDSTTDAVSTDSSLAIGIINNGAGFKTGINFGYNALTGNDGHTIGQYGQAIVMPEGDQILWDYCDNATTFPSSCSQNKQGAGLWSEVTSNASSANLVFTNGGIQIRQNGSGASLQVDAGAIYAGAGNGATYNPGDVISSESTTAGVYRAGGSGSEGVLDFGATTASTWTFKQPVTVQGLLASTSGVQPNGTTGGYAPEAMPLGVLSAHPKNVTGTCAVTSPSTDCTFPNSFTFSDTTYTCTLGPQGTTPVSDSYVNKSTTQITVYASGSATFSYSCWR